MKKPVLGALHQPEYTGENRCEACTVVNAIIAAVLGAIVARKSKFIAAITIGVSAVLIYLRGYLVPGTPTLTKRYLSPSLLRLFGKEPEPTTYSGFGPVESEPNESPAAPQSRPSTQGDTESTDAAVADGDRTKTEDRTNADADPITPEAFFLEHDIIEPCAEVEDLCLTESFRIEWHEEINRIDADALKAEDAAVAVGLTDEEGGFEIVHHGDARVLRRDNRRIGQWPSQAALVADVTAARVLDSWVEEWTSLTIDKKGALLNGLRLFLETCPMTGGDVTMDEETVESCCRSYDVIAVTCAKSGERLFEHPVTESED
ncbi:hypothetical protein [Natrarchaeobaculum sulfurireducens]|nr:hypothetical protein [Natrarchaeobaculum sulfurireducens]